MINKIVIYSDGGARGNPGPAACAFIVQDLNGKLLHKDSKYLGETTNNFAEYQGAILALTQTLENEKDIEGVINFYMDSELVVKQINGQYKVKEPTLQKLHKEVKELLNKISLEVVFKNIPREKNKIADSLVNKELDGRS